MAPQRIFIDTDIGDDVDDALAIALAVLAPELEVMGISTVYRNAAARQQLAMELLRHLGAEHIPVAAGSSQPLGEHLDTGVIPPQCAGIALDRPLNCCRHGVELLLETLRRDPSVVLVAIGPLTNLAIAALLAPEVIRRTKIVLMGGAFRAVYPEYNIMCDPEAANIVLRSGADVQMVGLDVTVPCVLSRQDEGKIASFCEGYQGFLASLCDVWLQTSKSKKITLHDPLTVASLIDPTLLKLEPAPVRVELGTGQLRGLTTDLRHPFRRREPLPEPNAKIATAVDAQRLCRMVMRRLFGEQ